MNSTGWEFRSESHSGCAFWPTAVFMEQRRRTLLRHLTSTLDVVCALLTQPCWWYRPPDIQYSVTMPSSGFGTCVEQPAVVCQECTVADDVPSRAEDCTFSVVVWQWLGDRDCTAQYNCCLPATTDCRRFCRFVCFSFLFNFVRCPCNVFVVIVSP